MNGDLKILPNSEEWVKALLELNGQSNPPTDVEKLARFLNLHINDFQNHETLGLSGKIKAYLRPAHREIGVYTGLAAVQRRFWVEPQYSVDWKKWGSSANLFVTKQASLWKSDEPPNRILPKSRVSR